MPRQDDRRSSCEGDFARLPLILATGRRPGCRCRASAIFPKPLDPRLRGDDAAFSNRGDATRLALGRLRNVTTFDAVIPAKAGIHWPLPVKMDPRLRGDDAAVSN